MKTPNPKPKTEAKKPRPKITGYLIVAKSGYMKPGCAGQILATTEVPVQFPNRRAARRLVHRYERQISMLRGSLVGTWPKVDELAAVLPITIQPVHAA